MITRLRDKEQYRQQKAWRFFLQQVPGAGALGARQLALAEEWAEEQGIRYRWRRDEYPDLSWCGCERCQDGTHEVYAVVCYRPCKECYEDVDMRCPHSTHYGSLSNIVDPTHAYRRVIEAELALEAKDAFWGGERMMQRKRYTGTWEHGKATEYTHAALASSYEHAAQILAAKCYGRRRGLRAIRVTGDVGKSGIFQCYLPAKTGGLTSYGRNFHVRTE